MSTRESPAPGPSPHAGKLERPGIYRRRILIRCTPGEARADLEDDPHRYATVVRHESGRVTGVEGIALRTPWTLCREAVHVLDRLLGMPLCADPLAVYGFTDGRAQCTHMFDLAGLAIAFAARGGMRRQYDIEVPRLAPAGPMHARLWRDGAQVLEWTVNDTLITAPEPFAGRNLRGLMPWVRQTFTDPDEYEAIVVLRRGVFVSGSRTYDLDRMANAADTRHTSGACYVFQPGVETNALRVVGATRDFGADAKALLADLVEVERDTLRVTGG
ncbi:MAG TPA: hypothetical protein VFR86_16135 [Burkholderiaceae bacterium]|nr:hypothetical protein [Burkholderiaceae bacterium]